MTKIQNWMLMVFLSLSMSVWAEVFECKDAQGHIKYQDSECYQTNDTQVINLPSGAFGTPNHHKKDENQFKSYDLTSIADNYQQGLEAYKQHDYKNAFLLLSSAANLNHPESQNMLGGMYLEGQGVPKSEQIAFSWFKRSADLGYVTAQTNLAYMYHQGIGCTKDVFLAKEWYQKAIRSGDSRAEKLLAELEKQTAINVEKMQQAEAQKYQAVYEKIKSPPLPPIEKSSAVSSTSWLVIFVLLAFAILLIINRLKKSNSTKFINNLKNPNPISVKTSSKAHAESKENQEAINQNHQQKDLSESEKKELLQSAIKWIEAERYKKQSLPSDNSTLQEDVESYETYQQDSPNTRQFKSLLRAIKEQKKTDPLIGAKVGAKEVIQQLLHLLRDEKGVHAESMLAVLGTLAGYACQASVRQEFVANQKLPEQGIFMVAKDADGRCYYFGDYLNKPLAENQYSVWGLAAGAAQSLGVSQLIDLTDIFKYVTTTVGTEAFGVPRFPLEYKSSDLPKDYLKYFWPTLHPIVIKFCPEPNNWPILYGFAIQEAMVLMKDVIKPNDALLIVMECAIPMSKIDIKNC